MKPKKPEKIFEGTQDEVVAEVIEWAGLQAHWRDHNLDENADALEILDAAGCDYMIQNLESEIPGQVDRWMTFLVYSEAIAKEALKANIDEYIRNAIAGFDGPKIVRG